MRKVLVVFANPRGTTSLRLGEEDRTIRECVQMSAKRAVDVTTRHAATVDDLRRALLEFRPQIVHISGHGSEEGLYLEDSRGGRHRVDPAGLAELIALSEPPVEAVVLNACFSEVHADEFEAFQVPCLIAMSTAVSDSGAIEFTRGFYDSLAAGEDVESAFDHGRVNMKTRGLDHHVVVIHKIPLPVAPAAVGITDAREPSALGFQPASETPPKGTPWLRQRTWTRVGAAVTFLVALAALIGNCSNAFDYVFGRPKMRFVGVVEDGERLRFVVENKHRSAVVLEDFSIVTDSQISEMLALGRLTPLPHAIQPGTSGDVDVEIERIVWRKLGQYEQRESLLNTHANGGIVLTATAAGVSSGRKMKVSAQVTVGQIRDFVIQRGTPCDITEEGCI